MEKEHGSIIITEHAYGRMKERMNLSKKASDRTAERVLRNGIRYYDATGRLRRYVYKEEKQELQHGVHVYLYGEFMYIFCEENMESRLITVFQMPLELRKHSITAQRRKRQV